MTYKRMLGKYRVNCIKSWFKIFLENNPDVAFLPIVGMGKDYITFQKQKGLHVTYCINLGLVAVGANYLDMSVDGYVNGTNVAYAAARSTSDLASIIDTTIPVGQMISGGKYYLWRPFIKFNTTTIPVNDDVSQVNLQMVAISDTSDTDFDIQIVKQDWNAQDPLSATTREAAYDNCLAGTADDSIWRNTSGMSLNTPYTSGNLAVDRIVKGGYTYYSLRSSRDYDGTAPTGNEYVNLGSQNNATEAYRPLLIVTHAAASAGGGYLLDGGLIR